MGEHEQLVSQLSRLVNDFDRRLRRSMPVGWPDVDLTLPQIKTLSSLIDGPERMSEIAAQSGSSLSAATAMIDRLVEKGLVSRSHDQHDRRVVVCELTELGSETLQRLWSFRQDSLRSLAQRMTDEELRVVVDAMKIMVRAAGDTSSTGSGERAS